MYEEDDDDVGEYTGEDADTEGDVCFDHHH